ncbi:PH domain-containing protein [Candidatus Venteria ishoeyi]|uniref:YokE-like PH domain-containing protein n=1 Tax=Candidatus Venteria ishoeyi TaxID=1899563 RepID=A0A1H6F9Y4_9GAMM|nr:PH domain-containing protein [Candidatus Venteria ishoeyi]SEH06119.1 Uncharacterised protein [Candidatus Venteria ishoeyi]
MSNKAASGINSIQHEFDNYEKYKEYTHSKNWKEIFKLNGVNIDTFGTKKELNVLTDYLEDSEVVFALASGIMSQTKTSNSFDWGVNTWLVALTNERFLFLDHAMLTKSVDTQSIRHDSVQAVSASQGLMLGKIQVDLGARVVVIDNCQKAAVKVMASLANKWIRILQKQSKNQAGNTSNETLSKIHESAGLTRIQVKLAQIQIKNQERIISLLEEIRDNTAS